MDGHDQVGGLRAGDLLRLLLPLQNKDEDDEGVRGGRKEREKEGKQEKREREHTSSKGTNPKGGSLGMESFFKDTRNERKQEAPRGLRVRELKFKMEIYQSNN